MWQVIGVLLLAGIVVAAIQALWPVALVAGIGYLVYRLIRHILKERYFAGEERSYSAVHRPVLGHTWRRSTTPAVTSTGVTATWPLISLRTFTTARCRSFATPASTRSSTS